MSPTSSYARKHPLHRAHAGFGTSNGTPLHPQWLSTVTRVYVVGNWLAVHTDSPFGPSALSQLVQCVASTVTPKR